jgi:serine/threonine-protein kinase
MSTRYVLHDSIGSGGMATVHIGHLHAPLGFTRVVAIKRLHPALSHQPEFAAMLVDEARITARVRHLNVIPTLDVILENGECFLVMEYVEGESLAKLLRSASQCGAAVPVGVVSAVLGGVLHGLHAAHVAKSGHGEPLGIIHRDVSPQNIIVGSDGIARVFDFGVAKAMGRLQQTRAGRFKGKLPYLAPEQFGEGKLDCRVDVYAASVTLWETLTTRRLFDGGSEEEVFGKILQSRIPPPSQLRPGLPPALDEVVLRGLARSPSDRFANAADMALALEQAAPPASAREVATWLESLAGEALAKRAALVTAIDGGARPAPEPESAPSPAPAPVVAAAPGELNAAPQMPAPEPSGLASRTVTLRMTVPMRTVPLRVWSTDEPAAPEGGESLAPLPYAAEAPTVVGLGSSTPPPHSLPIAEPVRPRRLAVRASVAAAVLLCSLAAPAFGWMALSERSEPPRAAAVAAVPKATSPKMERPARLPVPATTSPSPSAPAQPAAPPASAIAKPPPPATPPAPVIAKPKLAASTAANVAPKPAVVAAPDETTAPPASAKPRLPVKAKPAPKSDYLSSAPYSQRR